MTDPYKTAFNVQNGIAIEPEGIKAMAEELQKVKRDYEEQNKKLSGLKKDLGKAAAEAGNLEEQTNLYVYTGARKAY
ncbi:hypothetical protein CVR97_28510, partial [Salmonella enterica subsp. enterica serovar Typhimurium]|uniref:hypothetical protein n=1 Tax=Salmonella enterica TaxID=28901 RepID=UPI000CA96AF6